jgi:fatty acid desaturase
VEVRDYRLWWALFVFFGVLSLLVAQRRYQQWARAKRILASVPPAQRLEHERRVRLEGWRLFLMAASLVAMTGLVFAALLRAPAPVLVVLRVAAIVAVLGVVVLGLRL